MDIARCLLDQRVYYATAFSQQIPSEIEEKRHHLACPECNGPAFFRKATRDGRAACFGARPHKPNCTMSATEETRLVDDLGDEVDSILNSGNRIVLDLQFGSIGRVNADLSDSQAFGRGSVRRFVGDSMRRNADKHQRLRPILRNLIEVPEFAQSQYLINVPGLDALPVRRFFVAFQDLTPEHVDSGLVRGHWGMIGSAKKWRDDSVWLNSGGHAALSILLPPEMANTVLERYKVDDLEDLAGAYALVISSAKTSKSTSKKKYCTPETPNHIALYLTK